VSQGWQQQEPRPQRSRWWVAGYAYGTGEALAGVGTLDLAYPTARPFPVTHDHWLDAIAAVRAHAERAHGASNVVLLALTPLAGPPRPTHHS